GSALACCGVSHIGARLGQSRGQHQVAFGAMGYVLHTLGQSNFRQMQAGAADHLGQINLDELRQVAWQAGNLQFCKNVADDLAAELKGWSDLAIDEVQGHFSGDGVSSVNALEVNVHDQLLVGVPLNGTQQYLLGLA